ncbi:hypothetical protein CWI80_09235 [Pseudidiomarina sediminum]|uniref:Calcineurin-like phosphoesterase domain-containing protein n=1 Tax=Pseudidiomarina sediminum TaxID=431675 RepID=A0A432Z4C5_9GAMM|nr:metallophosphoesterase [Pseudidiomarina sediminum]RUO72715.1 hypothetical protein CWI80_09235 [Pseudidiomarina sediminum]
MKPLLLSLLALTAAACTVKPAPEPAGFEFLVVGDMPYNASDVRMLQQTEQWSHTHEIPFVLHLGDYKSGGKPCTANYDNDFAQLLEDFAPLPVFYTPGDNEWTDCDRFEDPNTGAKYSELARLTEVRRRFAVLPEGSASLRAEQQQSLPENMAWQHRNVHFMTVHVSGTNNGRDHVAVDDLELALQAANAREQGAVHWIRQQFSTARANQAEAVVLAMQADMTVHAGFHEQTPCTAVARGNQACDAYVVIRREIQQQAQRFKKPVLVIHGDTPEFELVRDFAGNEASNLWRLNAAGDAGVNAFGVAYGTQDVTEVRYTGDLMQPFEMKGVFTK